MASKKPDPAVPATLQPKIEDVGRSVSPEAVVAYGKIREIKDRSHRLRTILKAWKDQQTLDRGLREKYAHWLMTSLAVQAVLVNVAFVLLGLGVLNVEAWTARVFIMAAFGEIAALVLLVVKYLFASSNDGILRYLDEPTPKIRRPNRR